MVNALVDSGADDSVVSEQLRTQLRTPLFSEHNPFFRTAYDRVVEAIGRCMLRVNLNGVGQTSKFLVFQKCSHDLMLGSDFFKATDKIIDCGSTNFRLERSLQTNKVNSGLYAVNDVVILGTL
ncbi:uncharacterized protein TNCV_1118161 [Trichonephila clavipes]|uniref:Peptidase A2 domain-containing protein n=1 Tax=Trichonephila clavipes TaxID=2585209 RepID=A0A8X6SV16_TRICX|nr:uncharacterized protein TNCV_1118161 [Trichonephila clavipes]